MAAANSASLALQAMPLPSWAGPAAALAAFAAAPSSPLSPLASHPGAARKLRLKLADARLGPRQLLLSQRGNLGCGAGALVTASAARAFRRWM